MKLAAKVQTGRLDWYDPAALAICLRHFEGQFVEVDIDRPGDVRTNKANRRYWKVIVPMVRAAIDEDRKEHGQPPLVWHPSARKWKWELHERLVARHVGVDETIVGPIRKPTHTMSTPEFFNFTESVTRWLASLGWYVPEQGEAMGA